MKELDNVNNTYDYFYEVILFFEFRKENEEIGDSKRFIVTAKNKEEAIKKAFRLFLNEGIPLLSSIDIECVCMGQVSLPKMNKEEFSEAYNTTIDIRRGRDALKELAEGYFFPSIPAHPDDADMVISRLLDELEVLRKKTEVK
jgi:hypothetical protein